jgi:hypothetical protein
MKRTRMIFAILFIICICLFDNYASKFGTGTLFKFHKELDFEPRVELYEANFNIITDNDFPLVHSGYQFPTGEGLKGQSSNQILVDSIWGMWAKNKSLYVGIVSDSKEKKVLEINSVSKEGVALDYDILESNIVLINNAKVVYFNRSFLMMLALNWVVVFRFLCVLGLLVSVNIWRKGIQTRK